jgi:hypothetical protein
MYERERLALDEKIKIDSEQNKEKNTIEKLKNQTKNDIGDKELKMLVYDLFYDGDFSDNQ